MREKEREVTDFAKLSPGDVLVGKVNRHESGKAGWSPSVFLDGWCIRRRDGKLSMGAEISISENRSLEGFNLEEERDNVVVILCTERIKTAAGPTPMRVYKVQVCEGGEEASGMLKRMGVTDADRYELETLWSVVTSAPDTPAPGPFHPDSQEGKAVNDLPF